jgi:hypothetical protein
LREFGFLTIRHLCPCVRCSLARAAVFRSGPPGFHVKVYGVSPQPLRILSVFVQNRCSRCGGGRTCAPNHLLYRAVRPLAPSGPKVCSFIADFVCTFRKLQSKSSETIHSALETLLLSFSLRFCSAFKTLYKTAAKSTNVHRKCYTLHTVSTNTRFFEIRFRKTLVARTRVQSVRTTCTFTAVLQRFMLRGRFCTFRPPWRNLGRFLCGFTAGW